MGGVRTALYNYLYAKQHDGDFILRIEDTDSHRTVPGAEKYIIESLRWCGIIPDEGADINGHIVEEKSESHPYAPYRQSQRKPIYKAYAEQLVKKGLAYYAFDTPEELNEKRAEAEAEKKTFIYNHENRGRLRNSISLPEAETQKLLKETGHWTIRFKITPGRDIDMDDIIRGHIVINSSTLDDKVLWKASDGLPTYHLANIVDDHLMQITEVIRGEEWLPSLPLHYLLYEAFGWERPRFAHLPLLLKPTGQGKLSKRDGDKLGFPVFPLQWTSPEGEITKGYREEGYYPQAFINMLALLGWNPGTDQEIFTMDELIKSFSLERVTKSGARFNPEKAKWFNQQYLRMRSDHDLAREFANEIDKKFHNREISVSTNDMSFAYLASLCGLIKERAHFVSDFWEISHYFFEAPVEFDEKDVKKFWNPGTAEKMEEASEVINVIEFKDIKALISENLNKEDMEKERRENINKIETKLTDFINEKGYKMGEIMNTLRLIFAGQAKGLGIAEIIFFIGKTNAITRIKDAIRYLDR
jgi:glutamyl-tRNA synthetase